MHYNNDDDNNAINASGVTRRSPSINDQGKDNCGASALTAATTATVAKATVTVAATTKKVTWAHTRTITTREGEKFNATTKTTAMRDTQQLHKKDIICLIFFNAPCATEAHEGTLNHRISTSHSCIRCVKMRGDWPVRTTRMHHNAKLVWSLKHIMVTEAPILD